MSFWDLRKAYLNHEINRYQLEEIISFGLKESNGSLKGLLPIFKIEEKNYKKFHDFLRKQGITIKELNNRRNKIGS